MSVTNMAASVHARLLNMAKAANKPFSEVLQHYAIERFLYRLSKSPHQPQFILKGALVFMAWGIPRTRPTRDIDLLGYGRNETEPLVEMMKTVCDVEVINDGLLFNADSVHGEKIRIRANYAGVRIKLRATLDNARIPMQIDIGFGDVVVPEPISFEYPVLLDLPAPMLRGYTRETVVAEKYHALVSLDQFNSRMKDFYDLWELARHFKFDGQVLHQAISETFLRRETSLPTSLPTGLSDDFVIEKEQQWQAFKRRIRSDEDTPRLSAVVHLLRQFLYLDHMKNQYWHQGKWQSSKSPI